MSLINCPDCGKEISPSAPNCPNCGRPQSGGAIAKKKSTSSVAVIALLLVGFVLYKFVSSSTDMSTAAPTAAADRSLYKTTAESLFQKYEKNEVATNQEIGSAMVEVTGTIKSIDQDFMNHAVIRLGTSSEFDSVGLTLDDAQKNRAASLSKGAKVTIRCNTMKRIIGSPMGDDCVLVQ